MESNSQNIVVLGGGAGGLELVARLCRQFKNNKSIKIILIDHQLKHVWKPLFHQVSVGTLYNQDEIDFFSYAYEKGFDFIFGSVQTVDRKNKRLVVTSHDLIKNNSSNELIEINYELLVVAIGSQSNDFNISGVKEHCLFLDSLSEAENFNKLLTNFLIKIAQPTEKKFVANIAIVGAGATGIELAAELNHVLQQTVKYQKRKRTEHHFTITVIEASSRILSAMPERISHVITNYLKENAIDLLINTKIIKVEPDGLVTEDGIFIPSNMIIWAAGVKSNSLSNLDGLNTNKINQLIVDDKLRTNDESIFAFGDCASCQQRKNTGEIYYVPPRAQAANQQAKLLAKSIKNYFLHKPLLSYNYKDYGSLVTFSRYNVVGTLMTKIAKNFYLEGMMAQLAYWFLYKKHLMILKGIKYVMLSTISDFILKRQKPEIKLH